MPQKPQYFHDLKSTVDLLADQVDGLRTKIDDLGRTADTVKQGLGQFRLELTQDVTAKNDSLKDVIAEIRRDVAVLHQRLEEQNKRAEEWDRRFWGLLVVFIGALLSLAAGLIVTLAKK